MHRARDANEVFSGPKVPPAATKTTILFEEEPVGEDEEEEDSKAKEDEEASEEEGSEGQFEPDSTWSKHEDRGSNKQRGNRVQHQRQGQATTTCGECTWQMALTQGDSAIIDC